MNMSRPRLPINAHEVQWMTRSQRELGLAVRVDNHASPAFAVGRTIIVKLTAAELANALFMLPEVSSITPDELQAMTVVREMLRRLGGEGSE